MRKYLIPLLLVLGIFLFWQNTVRAAIYYEWDNPYYPNLFPVQRVLGESTEAVSAVTDTAKSLLIISPAAGDVWHKGQTYKIIWKNSPDLDYYLRYLRLVDVNTGSIISINDGNNLNLLKDGEASWTIPANFSFKGKFRFRLGIQPENADTPYWDSEIFIIEEAVPVDVKLSLVSPVKNVQWQNNNSYEILWQVSGNLTKDDVINIDLVQNGIVKKTLLPWSAGQSALSNSYQWNIEESLGDNYSLSAFVCRPVAKNSCTKVSSNVSSDSFAIVSVAPTTKTFPVSETTENIIQPSTNQTTETTTKPAKPVSFISPRKDEVWRLGQTYNIKWSVLPEYANYLRYFRAVYVPTGDVFNIPDRNNLNLLKDGEASWTIPTNWPLTGQFRIRLGIQPENADTPYWDSEVITIEKPAAVSAGITIISPTAGDVWQAGQKYEIKWRTDNLLMRPAAGNVQIILVQKNPAVDKVCILAESIPDTGSFIYTVPGDQFFGCWGKVAVRIVSRDVSNILQGESDQFTIISAIKFPGIDVSQIQQEAADIYSGVSTTATAAEVVKEPLLKAEEIIKKIETSSVKLDLAKEEVARLKEFIAFGTATTKNLGEGERAGVIASFIDTFGKTPATETDWQDVIKIANGRWPSARNQTKEQLAEKKFREIYLRLPQREISKYDEAAVIVMAYGLRPVNRNLASEQAAINTFKAVYKTAPASAADWDAVRAIAYSGASRELKPTNSIDSDKDGLTDEDEVKYGTDPHNPDSDGDGYLDGEEVKYGYNPLGAGRLIK